MNYDAWKTTDPRDVPDVEQETETCEKCGSPVAACEVAWCTNCHRYSMRSERPEHEDKKGGER